MPTKQTNPTAPRILEGQFQSVQEMVDRLSEDKTFAEAFRQRLAGRKLIKALTVLRSAQGLSQKDVAEKIGCTQSKVSKVEGSDDADVKFGDLLALILAADHEMRIILVPKGTTIVDEVTMHALVIKRLLHRLVGLAEDGKAMTKGVAAFLEEAACNLTKIIRTAAETLPKMPEEPALPVQVETADFDEAPSSSLKESVADEEDCQAIPSR